MFLIKVVEEIKTHILCSVTFLFENLSVYEIIGGENGTEREVTDENIISHMRFVCWITTTTDTHSE
jgi:hypothetical protein